MSVRADILEIARVLEEAARCPDLTRYEAPAPVGADAGVYAALMPRLPRHRGVPDALEPARFRPCFLVNGLIVAAGLPRHARIVLLEGLAAGLLEFADHFELIAERPADGGGPLPDERRAAQARYFAYCAAQLIECGVPVSGALATMKGDALDEDTACEIRGWIEDGPDAMLASALLTEREKVLWKDVFDKGRQAWPALRDHLVLTYSLPFRPLPNR